MDKEKRRLAFTGAQLKWLAIVLMAIDHIGAVLIEPAILNPAMLQPDMQKLWFTVYLIMRCLGRFSFPTFCFLLVEGFYHTHSRLRYLHNLLIFAAVSEVPFNLAISGKLLSFEYQNVFFTLTAGLVSIWLADYLKQKATEEQNILWSGLIAVEVTGIAVLAQFLNTDYGAVGVVVIFVLYAIYHKRVLSAVFSVILLSLSNILEIFCFPFIFALKYYNGQRGRQNKYFFYIFYPAHLLILCIIRMIIYK